MKKETASPDKASRSPRKTAKDPSAKGGKSTPRTQQTPKPPPKRNPVSAIIDEVRKQCEDKDIDLRGDFLEFGD